MGVLKYLSGIKTHNASHCLSSLASIYVSLVPQLVLFLCTMLYLSTISSSYILMHANNHLAIACVQVHSNYEAVLGFRFLHFLSCSCLAPSLNYIA